jgi:predicted dehydrogenase
MINHPITVTIVGLGNIGSSFDHNNTQKNLTHASAVMNHAKFKLIGGVDINHSNRINFEKKYKVPSFTNLSDLTKIEMPDMVVIAVPTIKHIDIIRESLEYSEVKIILCEKPVTLNLELLTDILESNTVLKDKILVNYNLRTNESIRDIKRKVLNNEFGDFLGGVGKYSGGYFNNGSHMLDLIEFLLNDKMTFAARINLKNSKDDFFTTLGLTIKNGIFYFISINNKNTFFFEISLLFENCQIRINQGGLKIFIDPINEDLDFPMFKSIDYQENSFNISQGNSFINVYDDIFNYMRVRETNLPSINESAQLIYRMKSFIENGLAQC